MNITITIADDHPVVITGLKKILADYAHVELYDTCNNGQQLLEALDKRQPNVLLLDIQMPDKNGNELAQIISQKYANIGILALTNLHLTFHVKDMFSNGALGYLLKSSEPNILIEAIESVYEKKPYIDSTIKGQMSLELVELNKTKSIPPLTIREMEILRLIADEFTSQEIADKLFLSNRTIESHRLNLLFKFGVKNVAGLVRKAAQLKILE